ncbi:MAG: type II toxin-antitoxin system PemK/MazF family toxin [Ilumatobacteraceae bacterium]|nr:type II toxin-antitoxin system PemK/MazF family toxin [Ilumatobacteraceae bacterium]
MALIAQGEIWLGELPHRKPRPYLVLTRQHAIDGLRTVVVAPVTTTRRGLVSELGLGPADGLRRECVATFDNLAALPKSAFTQQLGTLGPGRWHEVCEALRTAIDC